MKRASPELIEFLNENDNFEIADLYSFQLTNGTNIYYTSADFDIVYNGNVYSCENAGIKRGSMQWISGLSVDNLEIEFFPSADDKIGDVILSSAFRNGTFDGAKFQLDMAFYTDSWQGSPYVLEKLFTGNVDIDEVSGNYAKLEAKSITEILNMQFPPDIYQASCGYTLYNNACGVLKSNFSLNANALSGSSKKTINCFLSKPSGYFDQGVILFTSGQNLNIKRAVKSHLNGVLTLSTPLLYEPAIGDTFTISPGCNKTMDICKNKFNNLNNFSGTPFIPNPETTL